MIGPPRDSERGPDRERPLADAAAWARTAVAQAGLNEPIVLILLLIAFFSTVSGKPLDGLFMLVVGTGLAWDAATRSRAGGRPGEHAVADEAAFDHAALDTASRQGPADRSALRARPGRPAPLDQPGLPVSPGPQDAPDLQGLPAAVGWGSRLPGLALLASGAAYVVVVGSFRRYSWPATIAVTGLGAVVLVIGWRGPLRDRPVPPRPGRLGTTLWGGLLVAGGIWELMALLAQPSIEDSSAVHPTISTLTDPMLASPAGRAVALAIWLALGCFLVLR